MQPVIDNRSIPTIKVTATALQVISVEAMASLDGAETGGILLGGSSSDGSGIVVRHAGGPGRNALRTPTRFDRDLRHAQRLAEYAWQADGSQWIGEWHTHPAGPLMPSDRDLSSYYAHLSDVELGFRQFISIIGGIHNDQTILSGWIIRPRELLAARLIAEGSATA